MEGLPDLALSNIVRHLDNDSRKNLRLAGKFGMGMVCAGSEIAYVQWGGVVDRFAAFPRKVVVKCPFGTLAAQMFHESPQWLMDQWPSTATELEWDCFNIGSTSAMPMNWLADDPRVLRQHIRVHHLVLPAALPESVDSITCNVLSGIDEDPLPHVKHLSTSSQRKTTDPIGTWRTGFHLTRFTSLRTLYISSSLIVSQPCTTGDMLMQLKNFPFLETVTLKNFKSGVLPALEDSSFPALRTLVLLPRFPSSDIIGGVGMTIPFLGNLAPCSLLQTLIVRGPDDASITKLESVRHLTHVRASPAMYFFPNSLFGMHLISYTTIGDILQVMSITEVMGLRTIQLLVPKIFGLKELFAHATLERIVVQNTQHNLLEIAAAATKDWQMVVEEAEVCEQLFPIIRLRRALVDTEKCG